MRDSRVVPDETRALAQLPRQLDQWQTLRELNSGRRQDSRQPLQPVAFRFATHQQKIELRRSVQMLQEAYPVFLRPIFPFTAAARMEGKPAAVKGKIGRRKTGYASCSICTERRSSIFCWWVAKRKATGCNGCRLSCRRPEFNSRRVCHWSSWRGSCASARVSSGTTLESRISPRRSACPDW